LGTTVVFTGCVTFIITGGWYGTVVFYYGA